MINTFVENYTLFLAGWTLLLLILLPVIFHYVFNEIGIGLVVAFMLGAAVLALNPGADRIFIEYAEIANTRKLNNEEVNQELPGINLKSDSPVYKVNVDLNGTKKDFYCLDKQCNSIIKP